MSNRLLKNYRSIIAINFIHNWIVIIIDSGIQKINDLIGRGNIYQLIKKCEMIKNAGIKLKINSVVHRLNFRGEMSGLIEKIKPDRWKIFQVLGIRIQ